MARFDMRTLGARERYNLITGTVVPRPIALITTTNEQGEVNAAPFSFFNALGSNPPIVAFSPGTHSINPLRVKDTRANVLATRQFVVNMVTEELAEPMTIAGAAFPSDKSEIDAMGISLLPSRQIKPPRIAESPVNLECELIEALDIGRNKVLFGEVVEMHVRDDLIDLDRMYIHYDRLNFLGRMPGGSGIYSKTRDLMILPRITYEDIMAGKKISDISTTVLPEEVETTQRLAADIDAIMPPRKK
ncbi:flavin reductase family protein [Afipia sp. DC4300-2b1]|uniref:flavin reductase family protein n=1 Tax=Afipia sp. DC4300-2b1 TaxID=2804672 RepID=UPI003CFB2289